MWQHAFYALAPCLTNLGWGETIMLVPLTDLFRLVWKTFAEEETLHVDEVHRIWNRTVDRGSEVKELSL